ncbi:hypothetical protein HPB52_008412 [Rhipicephalus sanguineus]|uniref:Uncharacterized protein n=1 Tax=Rhipicephalus sanguineus TaxID=34632 RepID=A0A9D4Q5T0_RHISA|nr:hypothetical protein HPB52_008412 [Rhipicephalus sanguineus]
MDVESKQIRSSDPLPQSSSEGGTSNGILAKAYSFISFGPSNVSRSITLPTSLRLTMDAELQTRVSLPVVLINRKGLYVIIAVLGVSILGCAGVLTYSFSSYAKLKQNAEEVRSYIASRTKAADRPSGDKQAAAGVAGVTSADQRLVRVKAVIPLAAESAQQVGYAAMPTSSGIPEGRGVNDTFAVVARQEISDTEAAGQHFRFADLGQGDGVSNGMIATNVTGSSGVATQR